MNDVVNPATYERLAISARDNGLYVVTLNRPEKRNALSGQMLSDLAKVAADLAADDLVELTGMEIERANQLIIKAREPWFA